MAAAVAAALQHRRLKGRGAHIDASMYEICVQQMWPAILAAQLGEVPQRSGNDDPTAFAQGVYPTRGDDRWIAIRVASAADWARLCVLAGGQDIAAWTSNHSDTELMDLLQAAGIAAGSLQDMQDLLEADPALAARGALLPLPHARLGTFGHVRTPLSFSRNVCMPFRPPGIGEHSAVIARALGGLPQDRVAALAAAGVFT
jgi:crotonobetainyl-CoA:carnitine CoA-transferase CaiB-like acyl-CoA transferase